VKNRAGHLLAAAYLSENKISQQAYKSISAIAMIKPRSPAYSRIICHRRVLARKTTLYKIYCASNNPLQVQRRRFFRHTALPSAAIAVSYDYLRRFVCRKNFPPLHPTEVIRGFPYYSKKGKDKTRACFPMSENRLLFRL
jgi:hypothetical protein